MSSLEEFLDELGPEPPALDDEEAWSSWRITDLGEAEWAMRKFGKATREREALQEQADGWIEQVRDWLRREEAPLRLEEERWRTLLTRFLQERREDPSDGRATVKLPSGDIVSRKVPARPEIVKEAEEQFIEWARERKVPVVKAKWSPVMKEVKSHIEFLDVLLPTVGDYSMKLWNLDDGHLIAVPETMPSDQVMALLKGLTEFILLDAGSHRIQTCAVFETGTGYELVPGVVQVPEHVNYDVKEFRP